MKENSKQSRAVCFLGRRTLEGLQAGFGARGWLGRTSQVALVVNNMPANAGDIRDTGSIPVSGRCPGEGNGNPFQYSCMENPMDEEPVGLQSMGSQRVRND